MKKTKKRWKNRKNRRDSESFSFLFFNPVLTTCFFFSKSTFSSRLPGPTTPATLTRTRIPVLTPVAAPPSDSLYPLFAPVSSEEYDGKMDAFGTRATPLDWLNETITAVNEALTDARFDDLDGGAGWRDVTVAELQEMLQLRELFSFRSGKGWY